MTAYYNEFDPKAAAWLRELIRQGHIAPGDVDERSIADVRPTDLAGYTQCHFFAGIGVWSYALRRAGWSDNRPVWTGSCPCQPFSAAGKGGGFDDERHLWPHFHYLIEKCGPDVVFGEQVASKDGLAWIDLVQADLEGAGYANGAVDFCSAGVGAPHIRQRLYWFGERLEDAPGKRWEGLGQHRHDDAGAGGLVSAGGSWLSELDDAIGTGLEGQRNGHSASSGRLAAAGSVAPTGGLGRLADCDGGASGQRRPLGGRSPNRSDAVQRAGFSSVSEPDGMADAKSGRCPHQPERHEPDLQGGSTVQLGFNDGANGGIGGGRDTAGSGAGSAFSGGTAGAGSAVERPGPTNGLWGDADWLFCRDGKWRPVEPGTFPLAHGAPARVGRLRGYGNAINAEAATVFIEAYLETKTIDVTAGHLRLTEVSAMTTDNGDIFS